MALYLANGIESGRLDYSVVFANPKFIPLKSTVDAILIKDGFEDKII